RPTDALAPAPPAPPSEPSLLSFLVDVPLSRLRDVAEGAFPPEVGREDAWVDAPIALGPMGLQFQYRFWRGAPCLEVGGDRLVTRLDLRYRIRARLAGGSVPVEAQCGYDGESPRRVRITASSELGWTTGWGLRSTTTFGVPEFLDACRALPGGADLTPVLGTLLAPGLEALGGALDRRLSELATQRDRIERVWRQLEVPVEVSPGAWLPLRPRPCHSD